MEKYPTNGLRGLTHWKNDALAGLQVSFVSLPLSLGIAIASGAAPITGIISGIIAGLVYPFVGGSFITVSGPAAGLAPALFAGMLVLGNGNLQAGYPLILVAICFAGIIQILLSLFKAGKLVKFISPTVLEGMLGAIGIIIIIQQLPNLVGYTGVLQKTILQDIKFLPIVFSGINQMVIILGIFSLFAVIFLEFIKKILPKKYDRLKRIPSPFIMIIIGIIYGQLIHLPQKFLIHLPQNILQGITHPAFSSVFSHNNLWLPLVITICTLTLIDSTESLATVAAFDKLDFYKRVSQPNKILLAMGISNIISSMIGGLTIIPGGIKSTANFHAKGRTLWVNFFNACFLILYISVAQKLIGLIPTAALSAFLIFVGWHLFKSSVLGKVLQKGKEQFFVIAITFFSILITDLLTGVIIGILFNYLLGLFIKFKSGLTKLDKSVA